MKTTVAHNGRCQLSVSCLLQIKWLNTIKDLVGRRCIVGTASAYSTKGPGFTTRWRQQFINALFLDHNKRLNTLKCFLTKMLESFISRWLKYLSETFCLFSDTVFWAFLFYLFFICFGFKTFLLPTSAKYN